MASVGEVEPERVDLAENARRHQANRARDLSWFKTTSAILAIGIAMMLVIGSVLWGVGASNGMAPMILAGKAITWTYCGLFGWALLCMPCVGCGLAAN